MADAHELDADIVHVAPFDPGRYPPLLNTLHLTAAAGLRSLVVASAPMAHPDLLHASSLVAPPRVTSASAQLAWLTASLRALRNKTAPQLVVAHGMLGLLAAWQDQIWKRAPLVYHCHDFDTSPGHPLFEAERTAARRVAEMWVPAEERHETAVARGYDCTIRIVQNCPARLEQPPATGALRRALASLSWSNAERCRIITRHGSIGRSHYIMETIDVLPALPDDVVLAVIGQGHADYIEACRARAATIGVAERVYFHGFVPHSELFSLIVDGAVGMCVYAPSGQNEAAPAPNKVYENLALGVPVVVTAGNSVAADVTSWRAGIGVLIGDSPSLVNSFDRLLGEANWGSRARAAHLGQFNYEAQQRDTILGRLLASRASQ